MTVKHMVLDYIITLILSLLFLNLDHKFLRWGAWFTFNCLWPGRVQQNDSAQQQLGFYSMKCLQGPFKFWNLNILDL